MQLDYLIWWGTTGTTMNLVEPDGVTLKGTEMTPNQMGGTQKLEWSLTKKDE